VHTHLARIAHTLTSGTIAAVHQAASRARQLWERHLQLVNDRPGYRPAIVAGIAALLVLLDAPQLLTAAVLAAMGVQATSHTRDRWTEEDPFGY